ncbi:LLM class flavin-dependent oxidoreductase [uncultured Microbacterium sp.]|uniref:LLM class flavin-dependent oxidoreductase n=1 Tax=uncultured Microbacterium sp. TaxID=191216 RepID=UPI0037DD739A
MLRRIAREGEDAGLDYLFFGDWLATGPDLEFRDPYLLARIDPVSAVLFLAGVTSRIGLIATVNTTYADPYTTARSLASLDVLTRGRAGINLVTGPNREPRATTVATRTPTTRPATTGRRSSWRRCGGCGVRGERMRGSRMPNAAC